MRALPLNTRPPPYRAGDEIKVLLVEDSAMDAELILREIARARLNCSTRRVQTAADFIRELEQFAPHVILSDFSMPEFNGTLALSLARKLQPDVPFIFVSGMMGEEHAIRALQDGATDYVLKSNLLRLPAAIERALKEAEDRAERQALEDELRDSEGRHRELFQSNPHPMWIYDIETLAFLSVNDSAVTKYGYSREQFLAMTIKEIRPEAEKPRLLQRIANLGERSDREIWRHLTNAGNVLLVEISSHDLDFKGRAARLVVAYDVTERERNARQLQDSESRFRALVEQAADGIFISDPDGVFVMVNTRGCELLGYSREELIGMNGRDTYLPEDLPLHEQRLKEVASGESLRFERMIRRKNGTAFPAELSLKMLESGMVQVIFHDITQRREHENKILRLTRIHAVLSSINSAIVRIDDRDELFQEACRIASDHAAFHIAWIGIVDNGALRPKAWAGAGSEFFARIAAADSSIKLSEGGLAYRAYHGQRAVFSNDITDNPDLDYMRRMVVDLGCQAGIALPLFAGGAPIGMFMLYCDQKDFFDDEEIKLLEELAGDVSFALNYISQREKADFLAYYDPLTGLPNRTLFFDRLSQDLGAASRDRSNVALILLDLDRFRMVNDTLGRHGGDELLKEVTARLRLHMRDEDTIARIGADSFALSLPGSWRAEALAYGLERRSRDLFGQPFMFGDEELRVSAAAGIALSPGDGETAEALFANAEAALRNAKAQNERFLFYRPDMNVRVADTLRMESQLRRAIENGELVLWYQPKVDLQTGRLTGFEALMRWQHPESGLIPPMQFIPLMEQTGLILEAGNWALQQVAKDCAVWTGQGLRVPRIAVNVSPLQLRHKDFVSRVVEAASNMDEAGAGLDLEITESVIMENVEQIIPALQTIRGLGVEIFIDDFGTGYSSLAYIARLPIHALKIDRSFVVGMTQNQDSLAIVRSVISLAHALRLGVVAEGMETAEQANILRELKCDQVQGYMISAPVAKDQVPGLMGRLG